MSTLPNDGVKNKGVTGCSYDEEEDVDDGQGEMSGGPDGIELHPMAVDVQQVLLNEESLRFPSVHGIDVVEAPEKELVVTVWRRQNRSRSAIHPVDDLEVSQFMTD